MEENGENRGIDALILTGLLAFEVLSEKYPCWMVYLF
jgi:hypothetical protein